MAVVKAPGLRLDLGRHPFELEGERVVLGDQGGIGIEHLAVAEAPGAAMELRRFVTEPGSAGAQRRRVARHG